MNNSYDFCYSGAENYQPNEPVYDDEGRVYYPYSPSAGLSKAVNLAITLNRPLLLEGDPGCGKTCLASAIAYEFTLKYREQETDDDVQKRWWPFYIWNVKSTTRARDGLYRFDAVGRLRDAQLMGVTPQLQDSALTPDEIQELKSKVKSPELYRHFQALGKALWKDPETPWKHPLRPIVLIDEIDKADSDFPNDLLNELEDYRFTVPETGEVIKLHEGQPKPLVLVTSNKERPLPDAFLRRCLYFKVKFPEKAVLKKIIERRFNPLKAKQKELLDRALKEFYNIRGLLENPPKTRPPGTSEFIDFIAALLNYSSVKSAEKDLDDLINQFHLRGTLVKNEADQERIWKDS